MAWRVVAFEPLQREAAGHTGFRVQLSGKGVEVKLLLAPYLALSFDRFVGVLIGKDEDRGGASHFLVVHSCSSIRRHCVTVECGTGEVADLDQALASLSGLIGAGQSGGKGIVDKHIAVTCSRRIPLPAVLKSADTGYAANAQKEP